MWEVPCYKLNKIVNVEPLTSEEILAKIDTHIGPLISESIQGPLEIVKPQFFTECSELGAVAEGGIRAEPIPNVDLYNAPKRISQFDADRVYLYRFSGTFVPVSLREFHVVSLGFILQRLVLQFRRMENYWWGIGPSTLAQWVSGIGTLLAVIIALFKDPIVAWRRRPRLDVTCSKEVPWTVKVPITVWQGKWPGGGGGRWGGDCYFVRIKVENTGRTRAEKVQVSAVNLAKRGVDDNFTDILTTLPYDMRWSNGPPAPEPPMTVLDGISRKMSAFCDIVSLCNPANPYQRRPTGMPAYPAPLTVGQLQLEFDLADEWHLLAPGTYRLTLRIGAANVEPIDRTIEFAHDGRWTPEELAMRRDYLAVSLIRAGIQGMSRVARNDWKKFIRAIGNRLGI